MKPKNNAAFTLIELSVVLVIIGLIVGGVLVGRDLIRAASARSTLSQLEKFNTATSTFRTKYGYFPGDITDPDATRFGFIARGVKAGEGNGDGQIQGVDGNETLIPAGNGIGETTMFWVDLSKAGLIEGKFNSAQPTPASGWNQPTGNAVGSYLPSAKMERGNYFYVWNGSDINAVYGPGSGTGINYFGLAAITALNSPSSANMQGGQGLTAREAYDIDNKIDDGFPQTGRARAASVTQGYTAHWAAGWPLGGSLVEGSPDTRATAATATTCYDNGNSAGARQTYSLSTNNGNGVNCSLSFQFQ